MPTACALLEVSGDSRRRFWKDIKKMRRSMLVCAVVVPDGDREHVADYLGDYVGERLEEFGQQRVLGVGVSTSSKRPYDALLVYERSWRESSAGGEADRR